MQDALDQPKKMADTFKIAFRRAQGKKRRGPEPRPLLQATILFHL